jgi:predicted  nucleic acid-binding Zn-ribbon protein
VTALDPLIALQERDLALDRLRHRSETLPERVALAIAEQRLTELRSGVEAMRAERDRIAGEEQQLDDEVRALADHAVAAERRLYSGEVSSPRDLQALQADVEQLRRHQRGVEDRQLAAMERREPLDARLYEVERELEAAERGAAEIRAGLTDAEATIASDVAVETAARDELAGGIEAGLLAEYERCRAKANGIGAARLVSGTCQGCHLSIPVTEADRIRKGAAGTVSYCDNCGCILVP